MSRFIVPLLVLAATLTVTVPARAAEFPDGVEAGVLTEPALLASNCERIKEDGGRTTVIGAVMTRIVKDAGSYDFSNLDSQVNTAISCGLDPAIRVLPSHRAAPIAACPTTSPPTEPSSAPWSPTRGAGSAGSGSRTR